MSVFRVLDQFRVSGTTRMTGTHKFSAIGVVAATGAATLALGLAPAGAEETAPSAGPKPASAPVSLPVEPAAQAEDIATGQGGLRAQFSGSYQQAQADAREAAAEEKREAEKTEKARKEAEREAAADRDSTREKAADRSHDRGGWGSGGNWGERDEESLEQAYERERSEAASYPDNLDGWIREALAIMEREGIPGTYEGIHRNIMRESSGDPRAINNWDVNARNGIPSKGLLQVIQPTFDAYHVEGTKYDLYDPVANIVAACNYAADRYGSMDNVDSAY
ncbi:transglycosylase SLT domain-containing protein [Streptomyces chitinivorans]|uniref:Transglycosylase SLT domain-containing protein n=1 Tax=Streptomyces chitinivorans TaxID=1257027 RepID=A0ABW7I291_9ACTN|nr:transglycosylase SLT domain-containing protein [Streptomyces chitinivorans]MDH2412093.1 transglycosylase SLT domain-containing protein [Streptomyces chitinivorans]